MTDTIQTHGKTYRMEPQADGNILLVEVKEKDQGLWRPERRGVFWATWYDGSVSGTDYTSNSDAQAIARGCAFKDAITARKASILQARSNIFIAAALQADPDAGEWAGDRQWTVHVRVGDALFVVCDHFYIGAPAYVHTHAQAEEMARILKAEGWK